MPDKFDPYREALVMEMITEWPDEYDDWESSERARIESLLHAHPQDAKNREYVRTHTGFCRKIIVTADDIKRLEQVARTP